MRRQKRVAPKVEFSASPFGPFNPDSAMGGGYPTALFISEKEMKDGCLALFDKAR
jgi:hypothetical protein